MPENQILVGTAGWSYPDWSPAVYPSAKPGDRLGVVAEYLDCVEVDSSFYHPPATRTAERWLAAVARRPGFRFLAKAWQRFTHERASVWTQAEADQFTRGLAPLREAGRLDAVLFQFPWSFRNLPASRDWIERIAQWFAGWPLAIEVRHDSWRGPETEALFRRLRIAFCNIDQPALEHCLGPGDLVTGEPGYFRLHGRNAGNWFRKTQEVAGGRYDYLYSETELDDLLGPIRRIASKATRTFVIFNNHKDAKAFANALQLKLRVQPGAAVRAPVSLVGRFAALRGRVLPAGEEQLPLV